MAGQTNISSPYPGNEQFGALILLIFVSGIAGIALGLLGGFNFPKLWFFPGYNLKPIIKGIVIPPLIAMIVMGCIVRNYFGETMIPYPQPWTGWIRGFCLCILLIRGGLQVTFKGQGLTVIFISFVPQVCEATVIAFMAQSLFDMPLAMGYVLGYNLACISPSIIVPGLMSLNDRGYGKKKNIAGMLIAAGTFDDIICIICFGICKTIVLNEGGFNKGQSMGLAIGMLFVSNIVALFIGITLGLGGWFLKFIKNPTLNIYLKLLYCVIGAMVLVIIEEHAGTKDCKYIAALFFGYTLFRMWGMNKPSKHIAWFWFFIQPCLFGTVGGSLLFSQIRASDLGFGALIIVIGVLVRVIIVVIVTHSERYNLKERMFMGITWIGKATVQAALSALLLNEIKKQPNHENYKEYFNYANAQQTIAIFSIVICATTGAILLNSLGTTLLTNDTEDLKAAIEADKEKHQKDKTEEEDKNTQSDGEKDEQQITERGEDQLDDKSSLVNMNFSEGSLQIDVKRPDVPPSVFSKFNTASQLETNVNFGLVPNQDVIYIHPHDE